MVKKLIQKISNIRKTRNLFIHGVWDDPIERDNDIIITCRESQLDYSEKMQNGNKTRTWGSNKSTDFRLSYIRKLVDNVEEILLIEDYLIKKFKDYDYYKDL